MKLEVIKKSIKEIMSEPAPVNTLSWGRIASSVALLAVIVWVSYLVLKNHQLPALAEAAGFISAPYASNKITTAIQSFSKQ